MYKEIQTKAAQLPYRTLGFILSPFYYEEVLKDKGIVDQEPQGPAFYEVNEQVSDVDPDYLLNGPNELPYVTFILGEDAMAVGVHAITSGGLIRLEGFES